MPKNWKTCKNYTSSTSHGATIAYLVDPMLKPPMTTSVDKIKSRSKYSCRMYDVLDGWYWDIVGKNGRTLLISDPYKNKAQCRNVGKKFADMCGLEWRE